MSVLSPQSAPTTSSLVDGSGATDVESGSKFDPKRWLRLGKDEKETVAYLNTLFERSKTQRWRFDQQWYVNLSYYFGRQWVNWLNRTSPDLARLHEPAAPPWRVRLTVNRIKPAIRREMSKVLKEKPTAFVIPSSTEDNDVAAAKAGEAIFEHLWRTMEMPAEMWVVQFWRCITGTGFIKDWWDPVAQNGEAQGSIETEVVTPFHLYFSNLEQPRIDKQEYIIHVAMKSPEAIKTAYNVDVKADTSEIGGGVIETQYLQALNLEPGKKTQITVKEIWIKPCSRYPKGAMFVWAADTILYSSTNEEDEPVWPLPKMEYPFTKFDGVPTGRFYGDSSIIDLLPLQKEYNRTRSQIIEAKNQMAKPQLMAPRGSIDANKITSEPGLVIFYTPGFNPPTPIDLSPLPSYVMDELDRNLQDMADISGQHEITNGTVPTGVSAASALSFLQEQDDTMMAPIIFSMEAGIERLGRHFLVHAQTYWTEEYAVKVLGADNTWEMHAFKGSDLRGNTDLNIQAGSAMPRSLAAKQAFIMELAKLGLITPQQTLRYLEMAETGQMYEETQVDQRQAMRENMKMSDPELIPPAKSPEMLQLEQMLGIGGPQPTDALQPPMPDPSGLGAPSPLPGMPDPSMSLSPGGDMGGLPPEDPMAALMGGGGAPPMDLTVPGADPSTAPPMDPSMDPAMGGAPMGGDPMDPMGGMADPATMMPPPPPPPIVPVNTWDNHEVHIETHNNFRKRQEFENLAPELKEEFERHVALHRAALGLPPMMNPEQMQQIMQMQEMQGEPAGAEPQDPNAAPPPGDPNAPPADGSVPPPAPAEEQMPPEGGGQPPPF